jgi:hypothetical protein
VRFFFPVHTKRKTVEASDARAWLSGARHFEVMAVSHA